MILPIIYTGELYYTTLCSSNLKLSSMQKHVLSPLLLRTSTWARKMVARWVKKKEIHALSTAAKGKEKKKLAGDGRKPLSGELERKVLEWVYERPSKGLRVSRVLIMKKSSNVYNMDDKNEVEFSASRGWSEKFIIVSKNLSELKISKNDGIITCLIRFENNSHENQLDMESVGFQCV